MVEQRECEPRLKAWHQRVEYVPRVLGDLAHSEEDVGADMYLAHKNQSDHRDNEIKVCERTWRSAGRSQIESKDCGRTPVMNSRRHWRMRVNRVSSVTDMSSSSSSMYSTPCHARFRRDMRPSFAGDPAEMRSRCALYERRLDMRRGAYQGDAKIPQQARHPGHAPPLHPFTLRACPRRAAMGPCVTVR